ncbi:MAG: type VI secretion system protein TssA [Pseudomonadota bacterium]
MDVDSLLQSRGDDAPSGEDLEYDAEFTEMEIAAQPGEERQVGDEIVPGEDPDYKEVVAKAMSVLERSHDLRAAIYLAEAQLKLKGLPAFAECTTYLRRCLEEHWGTCHPQLDEDDDNDPTMRVNAVLALADSTRTLRALRNAPLSASRMMGSFSLRDLQVADGEVAPSSEDDAIPDQATIRAAFEDTDDELLKGNAEAVATALADIRAINAKFAEETPGQGPELDPLEKMLQQVSNRLAEATGGEVVEDTAEDEAGAAGGEGGAPMRRGGPPGAINSSTDVTAALDRIISFYERNEPSSPVPILLERAKRLVNADFLTIMKDMAPLGVENVNLIGGIEEKEEGYY